MIARSSSSVQFSLLIPGFKWLCHRSRHYLPILPGNLLAMVDQFFGPLEYTISLIISSSSLLHGPLTNSGFRTFYQRCSHYTSVRFGKLTAIYFQFFGPFCTTKVRRAVSSSLVHQRLLGRI